jgi:DNA-directed RNA polymerase sigma subunit (sigma70/sigma32)
LTGVTEETLVRVPHNQKNTRSRQQANPNKPRDSTLQEALPSVFTVFKALGPRETQKLTGPQQIELIEQIRAGGDRVQEAKDILIASVTPLIIKLAKKVMRSFGVLPNGVDFMDVVQTGLIVVCEALDKFELGRGIKFSSFAAQLAVWEMKEMVRKACYSLSVNRYPLVLEDKDYMLERELGRQPTLEELVKALYTQRKGGSHPAENQDTRSAKIRRAVHASVMLTLASYRQAKQPPVLLDGSYPDGVDGSGDGDGDGIYIEVIPDRTSPNPGDVVGFRFWDKVNDMLLPGQSLSPAEQLVLAMRADGTDYEEIGEALRDLPGYKGGSSRPTVSKILRQACAKFDPQELEALRNFDKRHQTPWRARD